ncbi:hypothetical protein [Aurantibacillus circumpalustris]|uniref:hypothetical protein n=1 Tax=Aurantibacillus circumpalustris TaxID=3036359 RepID=UPI00295B8BB6|nr:hypothetical protein [Aurantibacillus circumpalustris]
MRCSCIIFSFLVLTIGLSAQESTISQKKTTERESVAAHKAMIIPFLPKLYLGEIDRNINAETKLSSKEIRHKFRDGLNEQLYKAFKTAKYNVVDLMDDTVKYKKDLTGIYQYLSYEYLKVPDQTNYKVPKKEKQEKKIEKGQVIVETNSDKRFMETRITSPKVVPALYTKYKTDIFVFINQLDMLASGSKDPVEMGLGNPNRKIVVHYTVYTYNGNEINSGTIEEEFDPALNNPKKIIDKHFSKIALTLVQRVNKGLLTLDQK